MFTPIHYSLIIKRDGINCFYCGKKTTKKERQLDHIHCQKNNGSSKLTNLRISCASCNRKKSAKHVLEFISHEYIATARKFSRLQELINDPTQIFPDGYDEE